MSDVRLSICIPTFNRAPFIRYLLEKLASQPAPAFSYEIIISDNASEDDTSAVVQEFIDRGMPVSYYRRAVNGGGWPNLWNAFHHAQGRYALYLADDDFVILKDLEPVIAYLDENPAVVMCQTPWYLHDAVEEKDQQLFYRVDKPQRFEQRKFGPLFAYIVERHIFPEIAIYRTDKLKSMYVPREFCYWAFSHLAHAIDVGAVAFLDKPYYRWVTRSPVDLERVNAGHEETMNFWDRYRGGLEYFLYLGSKRGEINFAGPNRAQLDHLCSQFTANRMVVAMRLWLAQKQYIKAYELYTRICFAGLENHPEVQNVKERLTFMAGVQTLARHANASSDIRYLVLDGVTDIEPFAKLLNELGFDNSIQLCAPPQDNVGDVAPFAAVITPKEARRELFVKQGYLPGRVFSESELLGGLPV